MSTDYTTFTFWEDSWNYSANTTCCGKWNEQGECTCKSINYNINKDE